MWNMDALKQRVMLIVHILYSINLLDVDATQKF